ncbi:MAG TPA: PKD domain-containing protein, partial [Flavisolibacter sp.]|nr:PKD domain-containing protein [Flavisolibacter sp.]
LVIPAAVRAGDKPHADFKVTPDDICASMPAHFEDISTGNTDQWLWNFGDNLTSTEKDPDHVFDGLGKFSVSLIVWSNSCADTITKTDVVNVRPPIAGFQIIHSCADKYRKEFIDRSVGATSLSWDFGDGTVSTQQNPVHTYTKPGIFKVTLFVTNGSCSNVNWGWIKVIDEKPVFTISKPDPCKRESVVLQGQGMNNNNIAEWTWDFGDGSSSHEQGSSRHAFAEAGSYMVTLTITDSLGCQSSRQTRITVSGPKASFQPETLAACLKDNLIRFIETSTDDGTNKISKKTWYFGDGPGLSNLSAPVQHHYVEPGTYPVSLKVEDQAGCTDSIASLLPIIIAQPKAIFLSPDTNSCTGKPVRLINQSEGVDLQYQWNFGDKTTASDMNPIHLYGTTGNFSIQLQVTDKYGCIDQAERTEYVHISYPVARFSVSDSVGTCPPLLVKFTNESSGYDQFIWDFGDGNTSTLKNPSHYYTVAGEYESKLIITGPGGCTEVARKKIVIKGPSGSFSYAPLQGCAPLPVTFTATTKNTASFIWDMGDGTIVPGTSLNSAHTYTASGSYVPKIIIVDEGGCSVPVVGRDTITVFDVAASFGVSVDKRCDPGSVQFKNSSISNDYIASYEWNFGDGGTSSAENPVYFYKDLGSYAVQLKVTTLHGCVNTFQRNDSLKILEKPAITVGGTKEACVPASMSIIGTIEKGNAAGGIWKWDFDNGESSDTGGPFSVTYKKDGSYTVKAFFKAANGCMDTATHEMVIHPLPATDAGKDEAICRGSFTTLHATGAATYSWKENASLSCTECPAPLAAPVLETTYIVKGYSAYGCIQEDSVTIAVHQPFTLRMGAGDTICAGEKVVLQASGADLYSWTPANSVLDPSKSLTSAVPTVSTLYTVIAKDQYQCFSDSATVYIKVWPLPKVDAGADITLPVGESIQLKPTYSADVASYKWNQAPTMNCTTCPDPVVKPKQTTTYGIQVKNEGGCLAKDEVTVFVICNNGNLFIPNTFSPNKDGSNDVFYPSGKGINRIKSLRVFNRWGEVVFERNDFSPNDPALGWDGKFKGMELAPDVYVYTCDVLCQNNEILTFKGDVTLLR